MVRGAGWLVIHGGSVPTGADFFISYTAADRAWAEWIAWQLEQAGYSARLQAWEFRPGENFVARMQQAAQEAERIIVVVSPNYLRSAWTTSEFMGASSPVSSLLLPVRVEPAEVPQGFPAQVYVDLVGTNMETARQRLLSAVRGGHYRPRLEPAFPGGREREPSSPSPTVVYPGGPGGIDRTSLQDLRALVISAAGDDPFVKELCDSLQGLRAEGLLSTIEVHTVGQQQASSDGPVDAQVREADLVLLVVSRDLLATEYGASHELRVLLRRHDDRQSVVIPVVCRAASWERQPFGRLAPLPPDGLPVSQWTSRDEAMRSIVDGVRLATEQLRGHGTWGLPFDQEPRDLVLPRKVGERERDLGEVFKPSGVPTLTFVEPDDFVEFRMALRQPGLGIVLEGPSGIGKTTVLRHAVEQDAVRLGHVRILSARRPADAEEIRQLPQGHTGLVAVDDFHRLPSALQDQLADYLKLLADDDGAAGKLVVVGIPGTAQSLVAVGSDLATRIRVFRPGRAAEGLILQMIEKGESALNIAFDGKAEIVLASAGSLLTAQMLCWHLAMMAGIERTAPTLAIVHTDIGRARGRVADSLRMKYQPMVDEFVVLDEPTEPLCIELLLRLAATPDGILSLETVREERPDLRGAIDRVFVSGLPHGFHSRHPRIAEHLYYDPRAERLIADDPQFIFYSRQLNRDQLLQAAGKRLPVPRDQIFICYSRKDATWLERLQVHLSPLEREGLVDVWSDRRIELGDQWRKEIEAALTRARIALLLVSADFLASDFIREEELPPLLAAAEQGGCRVIPILVGPSTFSAMPSLSRFQHGNPGGVTLSEMRPEETERVLAETAQSLLKLVGGWSG
jgi:hypothetical protein